MEATRQNIENVSLWNDTQKLWQKAIFVLNILVETEEIQRLPALGNTTITVEFMNCLWFYETHLFCYHS